MVLMMHMVATVGGMAFLPWSTRRLSRLAFLSDHKLRTLTLRRVLARAIGASLLERTATIGGVVLFSFYQPVMCCLIVLLSPNILVAGLAGLYGVVWMNFIVFSSIILSVWGAERGKHLEAALNGLLGVACSMMGLLMVYAAIFLMVDVRNSADLSRITRLADAAYFSTMTWTTVGYGDIVPGSGVARMFVAAEAINGSVVMAFFIAALVAAAKVFDERTEQAVRDLEQTLEAEEAAK